MSEMCNNCEKALLACLSVYKKEEFASLIKNCTQEALDYDGIKKPCITYFADLLYRHFGTQPERSKREDSKKSPLILKCRLCSVELYEEPEIIPDTLEQYWVYSCSNEKCSLYLQDLAIFYGMRCSEHSG